MWKKKIKYLGILIDSTLSWKHQISNISKKISRAIGIMYKLRPFLSMKVMKNVYYSLVYSHILYAIEAWGSGFKTDLDKLLILQKRALRLMTYNDVYPTVPGPLISSVPIFVKLGILKITDIYKYQVSKFIFKCINKLAPLNFQSWFNINHTRHGHRTRLNMNIVDGNKVNNLFIPFARTTNYGLKQMKVNGPRIWNALPDNLKNLTSLHVFSRKLKIHYISEYG